MSEPFNFTSPLAPAPAAHPDEPTRRRLLRKLLVLLGTGTATFALTTWWLVRVGDSPSLLEFAAQPDNVVRRQLAALNRGDLRDAYALFSERYRRQVPFEAFEELVVTHRPMFRTREVRFHDRQEGADRAILETHLLSADGERYLARYTLLRLEGRWWIDDVRWGSERGRGHLLTA